MNTRCRWHGGQCSRQYTDDDPGRCPFCHRSWPVIQRTDWHSCEARRTWPDVDKWRAAAARSMRAQAAQASRDGRPPQVSVDYLAGLGAHRTPRRRRSVERQNRTRARPKFGKG